MANGHKKKVFSTTDYQDNENQNYSGFDSPYKKDKKKKPYKC